MLWNASVLKGYAIAASDGRIGTVRDVLFDDRSWQIRWLVVDTGTWLSGRTAFLTPMMMGRLDSKGLAFRIELTLQQVKDSRDVDIDRPMSRHMEPICEFHDGRLNLSTGLVAANHGYADAGLTRAPAQTSLPRHKEKSVTQRAADPHLRSVETVNGYHIHANDGEIGHVVDFLLEDDDWSIHYLLADTKNWWPGKMVLISPRSVRKIGWGTKMVNLDVDRQRVKNSPAYDASTRVDEAYDDAFLAYYGISLVAA